MNAILVSGPRHFLVVIVVAALAMITHAQDAPIEPEKLTSLRDAWKRAKEHQARPIKEGYLNALIKLRDTLTERHRLDDAVLVRSEIECLTKVAEGGDKRPKGGTAELKQLRGTYEREMERMAQRNDRKYVGALRKLGSSLAQAKNLEAALAVQTEIGKIEPTAATKVEAAVEFKGGFREFKEGARLFSNRDYTWMKVPEEFSGYRISFGTGKSFAPLRVTVTKAGVLRIVAEAKDVEPLKRKGWETKREAVRGGQRKDNEPPQVMEKFVDPGELKFETTTFLCVRLLLPPDQSE